MRKYSWQDFVNDYDPLIWPAPYYTSFDILMFPFRFCYALLWSLFHKSSRDENE